MANDSVGVAAAASPTNYIDNESISTGGSPATVDRQRVRIGGAGYTDLADVVAGDTGQSSQVVSGARKEVTFSTSSAGAVASTDCSNYRFVVVHVTSYTNGTATFQLSNDNTNWSTTLLSYLSTNLNVQASSTVGGTGGPTGIYMGWVPARYFRINVTGISATFAGTVEFFAQPSSHPVPPVAIGAAWANVPVVGATSPGDGFGSSSVLMAAQMGYNGATLDRVRTPAVFKTATATASGDTALWTPTSSTKFRLLRFKIEATADVATSGGAAVDVVLRDSTTATAAAMSFYAPATSVTTNPGVISTGWVDLGNGIKSATANNVLNINLSAALTSGKVRVVACGTEE